MSSRTDYPPVRVPCPVRGGQETPVVLVTVTVGVFPENCPDTDQMTLSRPPAASPPDVIPVKLPSGFKARFSIVWVPRPPWKTPDSRPCATVNRTTESAEHPLSPAPPGSCTSQVPSAGPAAAPPTTAKVRASAKTRIFIAQKIASLHVLAKNGSQEHDRENISINVTAATAPPD